MGAVRRNMEHMPLDEAVDAAIEYCIKNNILKDFLLEQKAEVKKMSIYEFDEESEMEECSLTREEAEKRMEEYRSED